MPEFKLISADMTVAAIVVVLGLTTSLGFAASVRPAVLKAKAEAEAKGYVFIAAKEEILAKAKEEGRLEALTFLEADAKKAMIDGFRRKYPFIKEVYAETIQGTDEYQRFILEMKSGRVKRWDTVHISNQVYNEYPPYLRKFDILGMAEHGILNIPTQIIDPNHRTIVSKGTQVAVAAYNKKLISPDKVPTTWEGFLKPEFQGRKVVVDVRPLSVANLVPAWGLEKTVEFARKISEQKPIWVRGSRTLSNMALGEYAIFMGLNLSSVIEAKAKDPSQSLEFQLLDPVPVRFGSADGVLGTAPHAHAALLWLEFQVSPQGQEILDKYGPADGSVYVADSMQHKLIRGRTLSFLSWDLQKNLDRWVKRIVEAYGFPVAERR
ncbi:MAG TPA: ABC transporter substrate-binding protein [Candidatus Acidoferrales bacterium]|nr:ABC transporter substrate-binding protein [Candidatus Acidoferrales bacterium]